MKFKGMVLFKGVRLVEGDSPLFNPSTPPLNVRGGWVGLLENK